LELHGLTLVTSATTSLAVVFAIILGLTLRYRAHTLSESRLVTCLTVLLLSLVVAVVVPLVRWLSLLPAMLNGAPIDGFTRLVVPATVATSIVQLSLIASWTSYRCSLFGDDSSGEKRTGARTPARTPLRTLASPSIGLAQRAVLDESRSTDHTTTRPRVPLQEWVV